MQPFPIGWYWLVGDDTSKAWSTVDRSYVTEYPTPAPGAPVTQVDDETALSRILRDFGFRGPRLLPEDVIAERTRRLTLGFNYDFGDERGVHHIGTTDDDMKGWDEVAKASSAFIALGSPSTPIAIVTNTGPTIVTALEFQSILAAATAARQPLWAASFVLQSMDPIPADYADDGYWVS